MVPTSYVSTAEAARRLDTTPRTVRRWLDSGRLAGRLEDDRLLVEVPFRPGEPVAELPEPSEPSIPAADAAQRLIATTAGISRMVKGGKLRGEWIGARLWVTEESVARLERLRQAERPAEQR